MGNGKNKIYKRIKQQQQQLFQHQQLLKLKFK